MLTSWVTKLRDIGSKPKRHHQKKAALIQHSSSAKEWSLRSSAPCKATSSDDKLWSSNTDDDGAVFKSRSTKKAVAVSSHGCTMMNSEEDLLFQRHSISSCASSSAVTPERAPRQQIRSSMKSLYFSDNDTDMDPAFTPDTTTDSSFFSEFSSSTDSSITASSYKMFDHDAMSDSSVLHMSKWREAGNSVSRSKAISPSDQLAVLWSNKCRRRIQEGQNHLNSSTAACNPEDCSRSPANTSYSVASSSGQHRSANSSPGRTSLRTLFLEERSSRHPEITVAGNTSPASIGGCGHRSYKHHRNKLLQECSPLKGRFSSPRPLYRTRSCQEAHPDSTWHCSQENENANPNSVIAPFKSPEKDCCGHGYLSKNEQGLSSPNNMSNCKCPQEKTCHSTRLSPLSTPPMQRPRQRQKNATSISAVLPSDLQGTSVADSVPLVKMSQNPYEDFRHSMVEMLTDKGLEEAADAEELLYCYLALNSPEHHRFIEEAFSDVWRDVLMTLR